MPRLSSLVENYKTSKPSSGFSKVVRIKRIRFKPGYSRQWRKSRKDFQELNNLNFRYQYRLTRHIVNIYRKKEWKGVYYKKLEAFNILSSCLFTPDTDTLRIYFNSKWVFVNGYLCENPKLMLNVGDILQLVVHLKYYISYR